MASVSVGDVRDVVNVGSAEVPDAKVLKIVKRAQVALSLKQEKKSTVICSHLLNRSSQNRMPHARQSIIEETHTQTLASRHWWDWKIA